MSSQELLKSAQTALIKLKLQENNNEAAQKRNMEKIPEAGESRMSETTTTAGNTDLINPTPSSLNNQNLTRNNLNLQDTENLNNADE